MRFFEYQIVHPSLLIVIVSDYFLYNHLSPRLHISGIGYIPLPILLCDVVLGPDVPVKSVFGGTIDHSHKFKTNNYN